MKHKTYIALGSNIGDRRRNIETAIALLGSHIEHMKSGGLYETHPMYYRKQLSFFNTVIAGYTYLSPSALLKHTQDIEKKVGRIYRFSNGPREIDIDIIYYNNTIYNTKNLLIPHLRRCERDFVLQPLVDLNHKLVDPVEKKKVITLLSEIPQEKRVIIQKIS